MTDWSNTGGYTTNNENYSPMPCSCGYQGSGTEAFYKAVGADNAVINWAYSTCLTLLNAVDPVLALTSENIGWNAISGGPPPKEIVYGSGLAIQVPNTMPKPCYAGTSNCGHINPPTTHGT